MPPTSSSARAAATPAQSPPGSWARCLSRADGNPHVQSRAFGHLDQNTTLVTLSIGGNGARFSAIVQKCLIAMNGGRHPHNSGS
uniref:Uncharacterized protein n=1 Tax=Streptomyces sp. NBC_01393 TaxID=2903851 RepID=A0AAU3I9G3_9ACTN